MEGVSGVEQQVGVDGVGEARNGGVVAHGRAALTGEPIATVRVVGMDDGNAARLHRQGGRWAQERTRSERDDKRRQRTDSPLSNVGHAIDSFVNLRRRPTPDG